MLFLTDQEQQNFFEGSFELARVRGPMRLATLEIIDVHSELAACHGMEVAIDHYPVNQCWFTVDVVHHLLCRATTPSPDSAAARKILDTRLRMNAGVHAPEQIRSVRLRHALVPAESAIDIAVGRIAEQPSWSRGGGYAYGAAAPLVENAVQYFVPAAAIVRHLQPRTSHSIPFHAQPALALSVPALR